MSDPLICPTDYTCNFTRIRPRVIEHTVGVWWHGAAGWVVAIILVLALASAVSYIAYLSYKYRDAKREREKQERLMAADRKQKLALEEQRTLQLDAAMGNPEMLKIIKDMK